MRIKYDWIIFSIIIFTSTISQSGYATDKVKTTVVFFPLDVNLPAYQGFLAGLSGGCSETHIHHSIDLYNKKYKEVDFDLIITFAPGAYSLL